MAPEIKEFKEYDGTKADIFSAGVILFVIVLGIFPFTGGNQDEYYNLIKKGFYESYWKKVGGTHLSYEFKDLFIKMVCYDPSKRLSVFEVINHSWFNYKTINKRKVKLFQKND